jgi:tripartite-type tricarboxylate transporter receptor subunit TctC
MTRIRCFRLALSVAAMCVCNIVHAQTYPAKSIRLLVGAPPGGGADFVARSLAPKLHESLGQSIVVENRAGANGVVASELLARAAPDGYTIKIMTTGDAINPSLMKLSFDFLRDFAFITLAAESQNMLVAHPSFPAKV